MMRAICFKDVQPGDIVCQNTDKLCEVGALSQERDPYMQLFIRQGGFLQGRPDEVIGLLHRPWPEGKTEKDMLREIVHWAWRMSTQRGGAPPNGEDYSLLEALSSLRNAQNAYELGKPPKSNK